MFIQLAYFGEKHEAHQLVGQAKRCATTIQPKAVVGGIFGHFFADDIISDVAIELVGMDVLAKLGDSRLNSGRIIRLFGQLYLFYALLCII